MAWVFLASKGKDDETERKKMRRKHRVIIK